MSRIFGLGVLRFLLLLWIYLFVFYVMLMQFIAKLEHLSKLFFYFILNTSSTISYLFFCFQELKNIEKLSIKRLFYFLVAKFYPERQSFRLEPSE